MLNEIDLSRTDLNLLVLFEVVLDARHVGRAAEQLHLSPSAVSHGLARLRRLLNDPLFLRTPKGVVPTARAMELAAPIADVLARARRVLATAEPFDPRTSTRRFTIGAPDGASAVFLPALLANLASRAPSIDISVRQLLPSPGVTTPERAWAAALADLDARAFDVAVLPLDDAPARFVARTLYEEEFVIVMRAGHPFARDLSLDRFCRARHLVVSLTGDPHGFVDGVLAQQGRSRRIAVTVPNFMMALATLVDTDLIAALPKRLATLQAARFGLVSRNAPLPLPRSRLRAIVPAVAMMDEAVAWLLDRLEEATKAGSGTRGKGRGV